MSSNRICGATFTDVAWAATVESKNARELLPASSHLALWPSISHLTITPPSLSRGLAKGHTSDEKVAGGAHGGTGGCDSGGRGKTGDSLEEEGQVEITKYMKWEVLLGKSEEHLRQTASTLMAERPARKRYFRSEKVEDMGKQSLAKGIWRSTHDRKHPDAREDSGYDEESEKAAREKACTAPSNPRGSLHESMA